MRGLFLKEILINKKQYALLGIIGLIYTILGIVQDVSLIIVYVVVLGALSVLSCFAYDENAKWDIYAAVLPVSGSKVVATRYMLASSLSILATLVMLVFYIISAIRGGEEITYVKDIVPCLAIFGGVMIYQGVIMPLLYKLGAERGRYLMFAVMIIPMIIIVFLNKSEVGLEFLENESTSRIIDGVMKLLPLIGILIMYVSYLISIRIYSYKKK